MRHLPFRLLIKSYLPVTGVAARFAQNCTLSDLCQKSANIAQRPKVGAGIAAVPDVIAGGGGQTQPKPAAGHPMRSCNKATETPGAASTDAGRRRPQTIPYRGRSGD
jgi:hypothetical protein